MAMDVYLKFNGNCIEAVEFYSQVFGAEIQEIMTYGDLPPDDAFPVPEDMNRLILHTRMNIKGTTVMFSDVPPGMDLPVKFGNSISLTIQSTDMEEIDTLFDRLKEGGSITMDLQETFFSRRYGSIIDRFGIPWELSHDSGEQEIEQNNRKGSPNEI
jgi:PhnB protein